MPVDDLAEMSDLDGPRACRPEELEELLELVNFVFRTRHGRPASILQDYPQIYRRENLSNLRLIRIDGAIRACVAMVPIQLAVGALSLSAVGVNCTTTHPDWQRRGLGALLMHDIAARAAATGAHLIHLSPGVPEWYRRFDYEYAGLVHTYSLHRGNVELLPQLQDAEVATGLERHLEAIHHIHRGERAGAVRSLQDLPLILGRVTAELYAAKRSGGVVAYVLVRERDGHCIEHGGPGALVAGLLRLAFESRDQGNAGRSTTTRDQSGAALEPTMQISTSPGRHQVDALLEQLRLPMTRTSWQMISLVDAVGLVELLDIDGLVARADPAGGFVVQRGARQERYSRRALVKLLLGPERVSDIGGDGLPLGVFAPRTDHV